MLKVYHQGSATAALQRRIRAVDPRGPGSRKLQQDLKRIYEDGNREDRLAGRDRYGRTLDALKSERKGIYRGETGPPLCPRGDRSDCITGYAAKFSNTAKGWVLTVSIASAKAAIYVFHKVGAPIKTRDGREVGKLPKRDILGTTPRVQARARARLKEWADSARRGR